MTTEPEIIEGVPSVRIAGHLCARDVVEWSLWEKADKLSKCGHLVGALMIGVGGLISEGCIPYGPDSGVSREEADALIAEQRQWVSSLTPREKTIISLRIRRRHCSDAVARSTALLRKREKTLEEVEAELDLIINNGLQTSPIPEHRKITP